MPAFISRHDHFIPKCPQNCSSCQEPFCKLTGELHVPGPRTFRQALARLSPLVVSMNCPAKPTNLQRVFSESSNPHRPGQGATAACARAKYVPGGCWFRKLMPGHPRQNEERGRNFFAGPGSKDFNPPCPTHLTQTNQDLCDSQEKTDLNITTCNGVDQSSV